MMLARLWVLLTLRLVGPAQPDHATCGAGYWLSTGIRRDGRYLCTRVPVGDDVRGPDGRVRDRSVVPPGEIRGAIACGSATPVVLDERSVGCR